MGEVGTKKEKDTEFDIPSLAEEAVDAFWQVIMKRYPQATSGDLSPERTIALDDAAKAAIAEWIDNNVTPQKASERDKP